MVRQMWFESRGHDFGPDGEATEISDVSFSGVYLPAVRFPDGGGFAFTHHITAVNASRAGAQVYLELAWSVISGNTGNVHWRIGGRSLVDGSTINPPPLITVANVIGQHPAAGVKMHYNATGWITYSTIAFTLPINGGILWSVERVSDASDTLTGDAYLIGLAWGYRNGG